MTSMNPSKTEPPQGTPYQAVLRGILAIAIAVVTSIVGLLVAGGGLEPPTFRL
jgi:hypothetical protein